MMASSSMALKRPDNQNNSFVPSPDNLRAYRNALGQFGTGVAVVSINTPDGPIGMTINSFSSVSLDPPLILWCLAKSAGRFDPFNEAVDFAVQILRQDQAHLANAFAKDADAFAQNEWRLNGQDVPVLNQPLACFECEREAVHDAGDHVVIIGRVTNVNVGTGEPLLFVGGKLGGFSQT